ncbi:MAG TPA: AAA family ATPase [Rhizobiaceae bacterium]
MITKFKPPEDAAMKSGNGIEHRAITVLFADLVNSTSHMESLGPEDYGEMLRSFHSICNETVRRHYGVVAQYQGDGIICHFGYPTAAEDDAARAVSAGLDILSEIEGRTGDVAVPLATRIGISTGTAMIDTKLDQFGASAVGPCINRAARLEALAQPGSVLICDDTQRLVGSLFRLRDHGAHVLKGFADPQRVYRVEGRPRGAGTRFEALRGGRRIAPLIGRDAELETLVGHFASVGEGGCRSVVVSGEAGLGKSRLVNALREDDRTRNSTAFVLQCSPEHSGTPLYPLRSYLEWVAGAGPSDNAEIRHAKLERLFSKVWRAEGDDLSTLLDLLSPLGSNTKPDQSDSVPLRRQTAFRLLSKAILRSLPRQRSVQMLFEDAHWIDPSTAEFLRVLTEQAREHPVLVVVTTRPDPPLGDFFDSSADHIALRPLADAEAMELARATLENADLDDDAVALIIEKSEGVPLFVEEYADVVQQTGTGALARRQVPLTLGALIQGKLDRLEPTTRQFARAASAVGRSFDADTICGITELERDKAGEIASALFGMKLVHPTGASSGDGGMSFAHALIRDAIYAGMNRDQRSQLHNRIAEHYLLQGGEMRIGEHVLADHLARAGRHREAIERFLGAALEAAGGGAAAEALAHLENALASIGLLPEGEERDLLELRIRSIQGPTQMVTRGPGNPDFGATQARAMDLLDRLGLQTSMVPVIYNTALHAWATADLDRAMTIGESIHRINDQSPSDAACMAATTMRGLVAWHQGRNRLAEISLSATVTTHRPEIHADLYSIFLKEFGVFSLFYLGLTKTILGDPEAGADCAERAFALGQTMGFPHARGFGMLARFNTAMLREDLAAAEQHSALALEFSTHQRFPEFAAMSRFVLGWVATRRGNLAGGLAEMLAGFETWAATGFRCWQALFAAYIAEAQVAAGDLSGAEALLDRYEGLVRTSGENQTKVPLMTSRALLFRALGRSAEALALASAARELAEAQSARLWRDKLEARFRL